MIPVRLTLDPAFRVGPVRRRTFGSFVEHLGPLRLHRHPRPRAPDAPTPTGSARTCSS